MKFEPGDTVQNVMNKKVYIVVSVDEAPYVTIVRKGEETDAEVPEGEGISMHEDFLEKV